LQRPCVLNAEYKPVVTNSTERDLSLWPHDFPIRRTGLTR
jgi:hypothetical protein